MTRFEPEKPVEVKGSGHVTIPASNAGRAVLFYRRVFGLRAVAWPGGEGTLQVLMCGRGLCLAIREQQGVTTLPKRLLFEVGDLDQARERLWDLGVPLADGGLGPRFDPERGCRSLRVRDPDGHSIELVESALAPASLAREEKVVALRR